MSDDGYRGVSWSLDSGERCSRCLCGLWCGTVISNYHGNYIRGPGVCSLAVYVALAVWRVGRDESVFRSLLLFAVLQPAHARGGDYKLIISCELFIAIVLALGRAIANWEHYTG